MKRYYLFAVAIGVCLLVRTPVASASDCTAEATVGNSWISDGGLQINVQLHVRSDATGHYRSGFVHIRVHYAHGDATSEETTLVQWGIDGDKRKTDVTGSIRSMERYTSILSVDVEEVTCIR